MSSRQALGQNIQNLMPEMYVSFFEGCFHEPKSVERDKSGTGEACQVRPLRALQCLGETSVTATYNFIRTEVEKLVKITQDCNSLCFWICN